MGTIMTIDYVMIRLRQMLKIRMKGAKNNLATRESIRSQVALGCHPLSKRHSG